MRDRFCYAAKTSEDSDKIEFTLFGDDGVVAIRELSQEEAGGLCALIQEGLSSIPPNTRLDDQPDSLSRIAEVLGIPYDVVTDLNRRHELRYVDTPGRFELQLVAGRQSCNPGREREGH